MSSDLDIVDAIVADNRLILYFNREVTAIELFGMKIVLPAIMKASECLIIEVGTTAAPVMPISVDVIEMTEKAPPSPPEKSEDQ